MKGISVMKSYKTVKKAVFTEFTEKKSRFIGYISPVKTEKEAIDFVNSIRKKHPDARHNVYAYCVRENNISRFSDDGEPSGTAGIPVLDTINKRGITDVAIVVTRYFGGILLGGGGLVRAYGRAASDAIGVAGCVKMVYSSVYRINADYHFFGKIEYELKKLSLNAEDKEYASDVSFSVSVVEEKAEEMKKRLVEVTGGNVKIHKAEEKFAEFDEDFKEE